MPESYRPDPVDQAGRAACFIAVYCLLVVGIGLPLKLIAGTDFFSFTPSPLIELTILFTALILEFAGLSLWYYRRSDGEDASHPFPLSLSWPFEGIVRLLGVLLLLYLSILVASTGIILLTFLGIPALTDFLMEAKLVIRFIGPVGVFIYLVVWYRRHRTTGGTLDG